MTEKCHLKDTSGFHQPEAEEKAEGSYSFSKLPEDSEAKTSLETALFQEELSKRASWMGRK